MTYVTTKKELQAAVKRGDPEIYVSGKLAKKMKGFAKLKKLTKKKMVALIAFLTGAGTIAVTAIATAAPTGGLSVAGATALLLAKAPAAEVSIGTIITVITLLGAIGISLVALLRDYDFEMELNMEGIRFKAKKQAGNCSQSHNESERT